MLGTSKCERPFTFVTADARRWWPALRPARRRWRGGGRCVPALAAMCLPQTDARRIAKRQLAAASKVSSRAAGRCERGGLPRRGAPRSRRRLALCRQWWRAEPAAAPAAVGSRAQSGTPAPRSGGGGVLSVLGLQAFSLLSAFFRGDGRRIVAALAARRSDHAPADTERRHSARSAAAFTRRVAPLLASFQLHLFISSF